MCGKFFFKFMVFTFPENALNLSIFTHATFPTENSHPSSYHQILESKITHSPRQHFFKSMFPQQQKGVEETVKEWTFAGDSFSCHCRFEAVPVNFAKY